jgi:hypothetical protein
MNREEAIKRAKQAAPLDRRAVAEEMRELDALRHTHPELSIRIYHRMNELLAMLDESPSPEC